MISLTRRLWIAWWFKVWPWKIPDNAKYISLAPLTEADSKRTHELAAKYGWKKER